MNPIRRVKAFAWNLPRRIGYERGPLVMSALRKRWVLWRHPHVDIQFGERTYLGPGFSLHAPFGGTFHVGRGVEFRRGFRAELASQGARITIGDDCYLTYDVILACSTTIDIGRGCGMAQNTFVADGSHKFRDNDRSFYEQGYDLRPITIAAEAQIHAKCTILNDIGHRAVIGANAVVTKPVPPYTLAAGVPARVIDYFGPEPEPEPSSSSSHA